MIANKGYLSFVFAPRHVILYLNTLIPNDNIYPVFLATLHQRGLRQDTLSNITITRKWGVCQILNEWKYMISANQTFQCYLNTNLSN